MPTQPRKRSHCRSRCAAGPASCARLRSRKCWALTAAEVAAVASDSRSSGGGIWPAADACIHASIEHIPSAAASQPLCLQMSSYDMMLCSVAEERSAANGGSMPTCQSSARQQAAPAACTATAGSS